MLFSILFLKSLIFFFLRQLILRGLIMRRILLGIAVIMGGLFHTDFAQSCTRVLWAAGNNQVFVGRTQDWTEKANSSFRKFPRGIERAGAVSVNPHRWTSKYGSFIITGYDIATHEGVNEKGLSGHLLYLAGDTDFGKRNPQQEAISVLQWVQYYLDNFATVAEAVEATRNSNIQIEPMMLPNGMPTMVHISLSDKSGDSAVIEYIKGEAKIYHDKRFNVMTNEPTFDKQIENLKQYRTFGGTLPLPGERTPTDRFVRASYYVNNLPTPASPAEGAAFIFSVIRNISVPFGGVVTPDRPNISNTIFRSVIDMTNGRYFFESTFAPNVVWVDYSKLDFSQGSPEMVLPVEKKIHSLNGNVTGLLENTTPFVFGGKN
jgi:choloylglycine hydrolase